MRERKKAGRGTLTICGLGIDRPRDTTLGTIQALKDCEVLFYIHGDGESLQSFLKTFCGDVRLCSGAKYAAPTNDLRIEAVAAEVCAELKKGKNVVYATYGHPLVFSDGFNVAKYCRARGYDCAVLPAPSAVDSILASVGELADAFSNSFVVYAAEAVVQQPRALELGVPVVLLCLDVVVNRGLFDALCDRIEAAYPSGHSIFAVKCADTYGGIVRLDGRVRDLRGWKKKIVHMMSLVVPAHHITVSR